MKLPNSLHSGRMRFNKNKNLSRSRNQRNPHILFAKILNTMALEKMTKEETLAMRKRLIGYGKVQF